MCHCHGTGSGRGWYIRKAYLYLAFFIYQTCNEVIPSSECFQQSCSNVSRPVFTKNCIEILEEKCEVIIEQKVEQKCTDIEKTEFEEHCTTEYEEVCDTVQQYECDDEDVAAVAVPKVCYIRLRSK